jgi:glycerophosphoryl diester phosphodiesterase
MTRRERSYFACGLAVALLGLSAVADAFDIQGHRGARGLFPENTLPAFQRAIELGVNTIECDLAITKDDVVVIYHDRRLNADITRDATGHWLDVEGPPIRALTFAELQLYDVGRIKPGSDYGRTFATQIPIDGTRIPRLSDLFDLVKQSGNDQIGFDCETKISPLAPDDTLAPEEFALRVIKEVRRAGMQHRMMIQSFYWATLQVIQREAPEIQTMYLSEPWTLSPQPNGRSSPWVAGFAPEQFDGSVAKAVHAAGGAIWAPHYSYLTRDRLKEAHSLGLKVIPWTVNRTDDINRLLRWGVDGIISDRPDRVIDRWKVHLQ